MQQIIYDHKPNISCFQKTNFKHTQSSYINDYNGYFKNCLNPDRASEGVEIFIKDNLESEEVYLNNHLEAIEISVKFQKQIYIYNICLPESTPFTRQDLSLIITQLPKFFVIVGDFNSHNIPWGFLHTDNRGKTIELLHESFDLILLNNGKLTRHNPINSNFFAIDLSSATPTITSYIEWNTLTSYNGSDHWPILRKLFSLIPQSKPINK